MANIRNMLGLLFPRADYERGLTLVGAMRVVSFKRLEIARLNHWLANKVLAVSRPRSAERPLLGTCQVLLSRRPQLIILVNDRHIH